MSRSQAAKVLSLPALSDGFPPPPAPELDPYLDAAERCFARHGIGRSSVQDVARELGVNRATVYRQVGNVDRMVRLLIAREMHRLVAELPTSIDVRRGPETVVHLLAKVVDHVRVHPVLMKVVADEPEIIGPFLVADLPAVVERGADQLVPVLQWAMDAGALARRDARIVAQWLIRTGLTLLFAPPPDDAEAFLAELLVPALTP